jgi:hypothetical protein
MSSSAAGVSGAICWACRGDGLATVFVIDRRGVPPGEDGHNILYAYTQIQVCPRCGQSRIEILDHDCFDYDAVWNQYEWYLMDRQALPVLRALLSACPNPLDPTCGCPAHQSLREELSRLPSSAWASALEADQHTHPIRMRIAEGRLHLEPAGQSEKPAD